MMGNNRRAIVERILRAAADVNMPRCAEHAPHQWVPSIAFQTPCCDPR
jgi:hypothetical protein